MVYTKTSRPLNPRIKSVWNTRSIRKEKKMKNDIFVHAQIINNQLYALMPFFLACVIISALPKILHQLKTEWRLNCVCVTAMH